jgi:hypothetical protein
LDEAADKPISFAFSGRYRVAAAQSEPLDSRIVKEFSPVCPIMKKCTEKTEFTHSF